MSRPTKDSKTLLDWVSIRIFVLSNIYTPTNVISELRSPKFLDLDVTLLLLEADVFGLNGEFFFSFSN